METSIAHQARILLIADFCSIVISHWSVKSYANKIVSRSLHKKMNSTIKDFFSKCDQIRRKLGIWLHLLKKPLRIWSHLLKKSLMENFIFAQWMHLILLGSSCFRSNCNYSNIQELEDLYLKMDLQ